MIAVVLASEWGSLVAIVAAITGVASLPFLVAALLDQRKGRRDA